MAEAKAITTELLRSAIQFKIEGTANEGIEERKQVLPVKEVNWLCFSYRGIKNIDYLVGLERLTKLQLDNNNITKIENLGTLVHLTDLDLSFNKIEKIENLNTLTGLLDLSLYNNKITQIEGLESLEEIKSLSLGNNLIKDLDKVMYLRQFRFLRLLCLEGNPLCQICAGPRVQTLYNSVDAKLDVPRSSLLFSESGLQSERVISRCNDRRPREGQVGYDRMDHTQSKQDSGKNVSFVPS